MFVATLINAPDDYRLLAMNATFSGCVRDANAMLHEDPSLLLRLERGGMFVVEQIPVCGAPDAARRAQEAYDRTRASRESECCAAGPGHESPVGPAAD